MDVEALLAAEVGNLGVEIGRGNGKLKSAKLAVACLCCRQRDLWIGFAKFTLNVF